MTVSIKPEHVRDCANKLDGHHQYIDDMTRRLREVDSFCQAPGAGAAVGRVNTYRQLLDAWIKCLRKTADAAQNADTDPDALKEMANLKAVLASIPAPSQYAVVTAATAQIFGNAVPVGDDELLPDLMPDTGYVDLTAEEFWGDDKNTTPNPEDINQGSLGDCWLLAALGAVADDEQAIKNLVTLNGDGTATVRLASGDVVVPLNALSASNGGNAPWVRAVEWAYAHRSGDYEDLVGGDPKQAFAEIFGMDVDVYHPEPNGPTTYDPERSTDLAPTQSVDRLRDAIAANQSATVAVFDTIGIKGGHVFSVEEVQQDPITGERTIIIRNPWGHHDATAAELAAHNVTDLGDGRLEIPEADFADVVQTVAIGKP